MALHQYKYCSLIVLELLFTDSSGVGLDLFQRYIYVSIIIYNIKLIEECIISVVLTTDK